MNKKIERIKKFSLLFDFYKELLTDIQCDVFEQYYFNDYSLSEIAKNTNTTRSSISDKLKTIEKKLINYENKLNLVKKNEKISKIIFELKSKGEEELAKKLANI